MSLTHSKLLLYVCVCSILDYHHIICTMCVSSTAVRYTFIAIKMVCRVLTTRSDFKQTCQSSMSKVYLCRINQNIAKVFNGRIECGWRSIELILFFRVSSAFILKLYNTEVDYTLVCMGCIFFVISAFRGNAEEPT